MCKVIGGLMSNKSTGKFDNAPVAYVLAQVRFNPYLKMEEKIPAFQDAIIEKYPGFVPSAIKLFHIQPNNLQTIDDTRWDFTDIKKTTGLILNRNSLILHTTDYDTSKEFFEEFESILNIFEKIVPNLLIERFGLRYVDIIIPSGNNSAADYVIDGLGGFHPTDGEILDETSSYVSLIKYKKGLMNLQFHRGKQLKTLPPELSSINLVPNKLMEKMAKSEKDNGILDFDRFIEDRLPFNTKTAIKILREMHTDTSSAFRNIISTNAKKEWK